MKRRAFIAVCSAVLATAVPSRATSEVVAPRAVAGFEVSPMVLLFGAPFDHLAGGVNVFGGFRVSKWLSLEAYAGVAVDSQTESQGYGHCCSVDNWRWWWGRFGGRVWLHAIHALHFELLVGVGLGASAVAEHDTVFYCTSYPQESTCYRNTTYPALDASFLVGAEVRVVREFGFRATGSIGTTGPLSLVLAASFGPAIHL